MCVAIRGAQIMGATYSQQLHFVQFQPVLIGPQYKDCFESPF